MSETNLMKLLDQSFQDQYIEARMLHYTFEVMRALRKSPVPLLRPNIQ